MQQQDATTKNRINNNNTTLILIFFVFEKMQIGALHSLSVYHACLLILLFFLRISEVVGRSCSNGFSSTVSGYTT